jgi:glutamate carboxypeptidase
MDAWVEREAAQIARHAERELEALVAVSSPSGDRRGAEEAIAVCSALLPNEAVIERIPCSTAGYAADLAARVDGTGRRRILLLGHLDTVVSHAAHRPLERTAGRLVGSGSIDMKGGVVLAIGVLRALAERAELFAEVTLLLVTDEEWRTGALDHAERFAGMDACLCFEAGQLTADGEEGVVVKRKAAGTVRVRGHGRQAHSGSAPDRGRNALLALATASQIVAAAHDPYGPQRLTAVPTMFSAGEAFNVVPGAGELFCDLRADGLDAFERVLASIPQSHDGVRLDAELVRQWPGMDCRAQTRQLLAGAAERLGRPVVGVERGGASDASHMAAHVPLTVDGLGPRGGGAHHPDEYVLEESLEPRAQVALAIVASLLG